MTIVTTQAGLAVPPYPHGVELRHCRLYQCRLIGQYPCLEVALMLPFHTYARTRQVRTTDIRSMPIEYKHFEMHTRT